MSDGERWTLEGLLIYAPPKDCEFVLASDYDALMAEFMALSQDDGKVERALESAQARIRELERARTVRTYDPDDAAVHQIEMGTSE